MKELYIDFDGVIIDSIPRLYKALEEQHIDMNNELDKKLFFSSFDFTEVVNDKNILNDAINNIQKLKDSGLFLISILTHISSLEEGIVKVNYIRKYFNDITIVLTPKVIEKTKMVHSKDAILVDDYSGNLRIWKSQGGIPIKFSKEKNSGEFTTIKRLDELIEMFKNKD